MLGDFADGQIEFYKAVSCASSFTKVCVLNMTIRLWKSGIASYL